ncbi:FAD-dependent oxidoreductase [Rhodobacterales bacterium HKCCE2091]|nr:FAD-dependent oxidoreductase [Rhodobacterales bacterium HKCCE2091]
MADHDLIVVGAGVAGLTAAMAAAAQGVSVLVIDRLGVGGQVVNIEHIENFPGFPDGISGIELGPALMEQAEAAGAELGLGEVTAVTRDGETWTVATDGDGHTARAVIWAAGSALKPLGLDREDALRGRGISTCASCDGPFFRGGHVVVAGGGDSAAQEALALAGIVGRVTIVHRGPRLEAQAALAARLNGVANIEIWPDAEIAELVGDDTLAAVRVKGETLEAAGLFPFVGLMANTAPLGDAVPLDDAGRVVVDLSMATSLPGLWAAGDVRTGSRNWLATAAGDGATAGIAAARWLRDRPA